eukprot:16331-Heterococcus_DN1.PRE.2
MVQAAYQVKPPAVAGQKSGSVRSVQKMFYGFVTGVDTEATPTTFTVYFPEQHDLAEESRTYVQFCMSVSGICLFCLLLIELILTVLRQATAVLLSAFTGCNNEITLLTTAAEERQQQAAFTHNNCYCALHLCLWLYCTRICSAATQPTLTEKAKR